MFFTFFRCFLSFFCVFYLFSASLPLLNIYITFCGIVFVFGQFSQNNTNDATHIEMFKLNEEKVKRIQYQNLEKNLVFFAHIRFR